jgi:hypothetical protein
MRLFRSSLRAATRRASASVLFGEGHVLSVTQLKSTASGATDHRNARRHGVGEHVFDHLRGARQCDLGIDRTHLCSAAPSFEWIHCRHAQQARTQSRLSTRLGSDFLDQREPLPLVLHLRRQKRTKALFPLNAQRLCHRFDRGKGRSAHMLRAGALRWYSRRAMFNGIDRANPYCSRCAARTFWRGSVT